MLFQKNLDEISKKRKGQSRLQEKSGTSKGSGSSTESIYLQIKTKRPHINEGFSRENLDYVSKRIE